MIVVVFPFGYEIKFRRLLNPINISIDCVYSAMQLYASRQKGNMTENNEQMLRALRVRPSTLWIFFRQPSGGILRSLSRAKSTNLDSMNGGWSTLFVIIEDVITNEDVPSRKWVRGFWFY